VEESAIFVLSKKYLFAFDVRSISCGRGLWAAVTNTAARDW